MSTSNTLTKNDLKKVLEKLSIGSGGEGALNDMTAQEIEDFVNTIDAQGANLADYVVEQDTNYTKWNSGKLEQWGLEASASNANHTVNFPVSFASTAYVIIGTNTSGTQANFMTSSTSVSSFTVYPSASTKLYWMAIGKWK